MTSRWTLVTGLWVRRLWVVVLATLVMPCASAFTARELDIPEPDMSRRPAADHYAAPGVSFDSPIGFGLRLGQAGIAVGGTKTAEGVAEEQGFTSDYDGALALAIGLGDPARWIGLDLVVNIISVADSFGDAGGVGVKLHRHLFEGGSLALGVEEAARWGGASDSEARPYAAYTQILPLAPSNASNPVPLVLTAGYGKVRHFEDPRFGEGAAFGSLAFVPFPWISLIYDWTGSYASAGLSLTPFQSIPFSITVGVSDIGDRYPIYGRRFSGAIGYLFSF